MADMPMEMGPFPSELYDVSKPKEFDEWFIETWSKAKAINVPPKSDLKAKAVAVSRATVRYAWLSAQQASSRYLRKPAYGGYKSALEETNDMKSSLDSFLNFLQFGGESPVKQEDQIRTLTLTVLRWLEASPLDMGSTVSYDFEACSKFAASLLETRNFLNALELTAKDQIGRHRSSIQNIGKPELVAFAKPFVEAVIFMKGNGVGKENLQIAKCLNAAWNALSNQEHSGWDSQINSASKRISKIERDWLKSGLLPCLHLRAVCNHILKGQTPSEFLQG